MAGTVSASVASFESLEEAYELAVEAAKRMNVRLFICKRSGLWLVLPPFLAKQMRAARDSIPWS
jgi:hypothetical protein